MRKESLHIIGEFRPKRFQTTPIIQWAQYVRALVPTGMFVYGFPEYRTPSTIIDHEIRDWHQDLAPSVREDTWLMVWANLAPTELKFAEEGHRAIQMEPFAVGLFHNASWLHRQPYLTNQQQKRRRFARAWLTPNEDLAKAY